MLPFPRRVRSLGQVRLEVLPCPNRIARTFIDEHHRHLPKPPAGYLASFGCRRLDTHELVGVAWVGRPSARGLQRKEGESWQTVEVTRVATDGTQNACSALLGACARWAKRHGARDIITYTLTSEPGASLRGAGFALDGHIARARTWDTASRPRAGGLPVEKQRWRKTLRS